MKKTFSNIYFYSLCTLAWLIVIHSCNKPAKAPAKFSLYYNGIYTESNEDQKIKKYEVLNDSFGYYLAVPVEMYYLQMRMRTNTLSTGQTFTTYAQTECSMIWYLGTYYSAYQWCVNITDVSGGAATGTFSGYLLKSNDIDTVFITDGNFLNIEIQ